MGLFDFESNQYPQDIDVKIIMNKNGLQPSNELENLNNG